MILEESYKSRVCQQMSQIDIDAIYRAGAGDITDRNEQLFFCNPEMWCGVEENMNYY